LPPLRVAMRLRASVSIVLNAAPWPACLMRSAVGMHRPASHAYPAVHAASAPHGVNGLASLAGGVVASERALVGTHWK